MLSLFKRVAPFLIPLLIVLSCVSIARGVYKTVEHSWDFRWQPERLFLERVDPWQDYLDGDPRHALTVGQIPNDLPLTYVLLVPYGLLPYGPAKLAWAITNILFSFISSGLIAAHMRLTARQSALLLCSFFVSTCFRWGMDNGQQCFMVLFLLSLAYCSRFGTPDKPSGLALGLSYFKYSFSPPFFFDLVWRKLWKTAFQSLIPLAGGLLIARVWLGGNSSLHHLISVPTEAANRSYPATVITGDLMLYLQTLATHLQLDRGPEKLLVNVTPVVLCFFLTGIIARSPRLSPDARVGLYCMLSVVLFRHLPYDYVVLLFPSAYCVKHMRLLSSKVFLACMGWFACCTQLILRLTAKGELGLWWVVLCSMVLVIALAALWTAALHENESLARLDDGEVWQQPALGTV